METIDAFSSIVSSILSSNSPRLLFAELGITNGFS